MEPDDTGKVRTRAVPTELLVNEYTTAKSIVFLHPFLMTDHPVAAKFLMQLIDRLPEIQTLAQILGSKYSQGVDDLEDPEIAEAWFEAVQAVLNNLPSSLTYSLSGEPPAASNKRPRSKTPLYSTNTFSQVSPLLHPTTGHLFTGSALLPRQIDEEPTNVRMIGSRSFLNAEYDVYSHSVIPYLDNGYSPVDWIVAMYEIDPESLPHGIHNTPFKQIHSQPFKRTGYQQSIYVAGDLWTANINIFYELSFRISDVVMDKLGLAMKKELFLSRKQDAVFFLRMYSGVYNDWQDDDFEAILAMPDGKELASSAFLQNVMAMLVDAWTLFSGPIENKTMDRLRLFVRVELGHYSKQAADVMLSNVPLPEKAEMVFYGLYEFLKILVPVMVKEKLDDLEGVIKGGYSKLKLEDLQGVEICQAKLLKRYLSLLKMTLGTLNTLKSASFVGRIGERMAGLGGYIGYVHYQGAGIETGPTPLETMIIVAGDPFEPKVESMSPVEGGGGSVLTLRGDRFSPILENNTVSFEGSNGKVLSVKDGGKTMEVEVPGDLVDGLPWVAHSVAPCWRFSGLERQRCLIFEAAAPFADHRCDHSRYNHRTA